MANREQEIIDTALIMSEAAAFKSENARLQERVLELGRGVAELLTERDEARALAERRKEAGCKAQDKWEEWVESELGGTSLFQSVMGEAKKNRAAIEEEP